MKQRRSGIITGAEGEIRGGAEDQITAPLSVDTSVNEIIRRLPAALPVFTKHGIDTCCGGALPLREAATRQEVDLTRLLEELAWGVGEGG